MEGPRLNRWTSGHTLAVVWAVSFGGTTVLWATDAASTVVVTPILLAAVVATGWFASWWVAVAIAAAASWMWTHMELEAVRLELPTSQGLWGTILASIIFLAVGHLSRHLWEHHRKTLSMEMELAAALERERFQASFFAMAAHEVGTPLTPLKLQVEAILRQPEGTRFETGLRRIQRNVDRLERLSKDLMDASRIEAGTVQIARGPIDLRALVEDVVAMARPLAEEQRISLTAEAEPLMPEADPDRVRQVVWNLVRNALKFTPAGGTVTVHATQQGDDVCIEVNDNGLGMTPEQVDSLFQPFTQFHREHVREGSGLGLFVSRGICRAHGGALDAASAGPGQGATFTVRLPVRAPPAMRSVAVPVAAATTESAERKSVT